MRWVSACRTSSVARVSASASRLEPTPASTRCRMVSALPWASVTARLASACSSRASVTASGAGWRAAPPVPMPGVWEGPVPVDTGLAGVMVFGSDDEVSDPTDSESSRSVGVAAVSVPVEPGRGTEDFGGVSPEVSPRSPVTVEVVGSGEAGLSTDSMSDDAGDDGTG